MSASLFSQPWTTAATKPTAATTTAIMSTWWPISLALTSVVLYAIGGCLLSMSYSVSSHHCNDVIWACGLVLILLAAMVTVAWLVLLTLFLTNLIKRPKASQSLVRKESTDILTPVFQKPIGDYLPVPASGPCSQSPVLQQTFDRATAQKSGAGDHVVEILPPAPYQFRGDLGSICGICGILVQTPFCSSCGTQIIDV